MFAEASHHFSPAEAQKGRVVKWDRVSSFHPHLEASRKGETTATSCGVLPPPIHHCQKLFATNQRQQVKVASQRFCGGRGNDIWPHNSAKRWNTNFSGNPWSKFAGSQRSPGFCWKSSCLQMSHVMKEELFDLWIGTFSTFQSFAVTNKHCAQECCANLSFRFCFGSLKIWWVDGWC